MSRLALCMAARETGRKHYDHEPMQTLKVTEEVNFVTANMAQEYLVEVRLGAAVLVNETVQRYEKNPHAFSDAIRSAKRKIVEEVFGEFRPLLYQISDAIHCRDWAEASRLVGAVHDKMFVEGV